MKTILAGTMILGPLSFRCFVAKLLGLVCGMGGGLSIGKEGPFIHMSCIIGYQLTNIPYFRSIRKNERLMRQMIAAAVSAGITAAFGAPMGGVLFGIEVTVTYYFVNNMWRSYLCAVVCIIVDKIMSFTNEKEEFETTTLAEPTFALSHIFAYGFLGIACGLGGALFVHFISFFQVLFNYKLKRHSAYVMGAVVIVLTVAICYPLPFMANDDIQISNQMFKSDELNNYAKWWTDAFGGRFMTLAMFVVLKMTLTSAAVALPLPSGLYLPMFSMGACFGRLWGEVLNTMYPGMDYSPASFAIVGAAAWVGGATHTVSTAVIVFELTGQLNHMIPVLYGVCLARAVAPGFAIPLYDMFMTIKSLPYLAAAKANELQGRTAGDLVEDNCAWLSVRATYNEAYDLLLQTAGKPNYEEIAVVDPDTMLIVGSCTRPALVNAIDNFATKALNELNEGERESMYTASAQKGGAFKMDAKQMLHVKSNMEVLRVQVTDFFAPEQFVLLSKKVLTPSKVDVHNEGLRDMFNEQVTFVHTDSLVSRDSSAVRIDPAPMVISDLTQLTKVHFIFTITHWDVLFVLRNGKFRGVLGKNQIALDSSKIGGHGSKHHSPAMTPKEKSSAAVTPTAHH